MKDPIFRYVSGAVVLASVFCIVLSFLGEIPWPTTFFAILMAGISLGALAEYRNII